MVKNIDLKVDQKIIETFHKEDEPQRVIAVKAVHWKMADHNISGGWTGMEECSSNRNNHSLRTIVKK